MKAIGLKTSLPIEDSESFIEFECAQPTPPPGPQDLLVQVKAGLRQPGGLQGPAAKCALTRYWNPLKYWGGMRPGSWPRSAKK